MMDSKNRKVDKPFGNLKRFGLMGGSFNPVHVGHLSIAQQIFNHLKLERVILLPTSLAPHKQNDPEMASAEDRLAMCEIAVGQMRGLEASAFELARGGVSYTIDTAQILRDAYGPDVEIRFIIGADSLVELHTWKQIEDLLSLIDFAIADREDNAKPIDDSTWQLVRGHFGASVEEKLRASVVPIERVDVSSTEVRAALRQGASVNGLVRHGVESYIRENGLYGSNSDIGPVQK